MTGGSVARAGIAATNARRTRTSARPMDRRTVLEARSLRKEVTSPEGMLTILDDVSFAVGAGETVAIVGASGAGKSTLLALLAGLDEPSAGEVWLEGIELSALDEDGRAAVRARHVGFVFQSFHLVPSLTAIENVRSEERRVGKECRSRW